MMKERGASCYFQRRWDVRVSGRVAHQAAGQLHTLSPSSKNSLCLEPGSTWTLPVLPRLFRSHEIRESDADYLTNKEVTGRLIMRSSGSILEENNQRAGWIQRVRADLWQTVLHLDNLFTLLRKSMTWISLISSCNKTLRVIGVSQKYISIFGTEMH